MAHTPEHNQIERGAEIIQIGEREGWWSPGDVTILGGGSGNDGEEEFMSEAETAAFMERMGFGGLYEGVISRAKARELEKRRDENGNGNGEAWDPMMVGTLVVLGGISAIGVTGLALGGLWLATRKR